jgi:signal transduction histidine kinase
MGRSIYDSRERWTYVFISIAVFIVIATVYFSNSLSRQLAEEERSKAEIWAEATKILTMPGVLDTSGGEAMTSYDELERKHDETVSTLTNFILKIINENTSIPVIGCNENDSVSSYINIDIPEKDAEKILSSKVKEFKAKNPPIIIAIGDENNEVYQYLYYDDSVLLKRLLMYPYVQLFVVFAFIILSFLALLSTKKAEQNKIWVGLSKETAHQLGTPISSLMAWVEYLKTKEVDASYLNEMKKDVERLETVADRFSKIGANPDPLPLNINDALQSSCEYMATRISSKVRLNTLLPDEPALVLMNDSLFSWVIENLTKNAVDAMEGQGKITYHVENNTKKIYINISDTGRGIPKSKFKTIFHPGYTTRARGWGLGLSLVKRIVESYPGGKIYVKQSEIGKGATFRIEFRKYHG